MTLRRLLLFGVPAVVVALAMMVVCQLPWPLETVTYENARRIRKGMTLGEVETILGGPARNARTATNQWRTWDARQFSVGVELDENHRVKDWVCAPMPVLFIEESLFDMFRRLLHL